MKEYILSKFKNFKPKTDTKLFLVALIFFTLTKLFRFVTVLSTIFLIVAIVLSLSAIFMSTFTNVKNITSDLSSCKNDMKQSFAHKKSVVTRFSATRNEVNDSADENEQTDDSNDIAKVGEQECHSKR